MEANFNSLSYAISRGKYRRSRIQGLPNGGNTQVVVNVREHGNYIPGNKQRSHWEWTFCIQSLYLVNEIGRILNK